MKKGFTLQEVLITLAIVGIVAAVAIPGIRGIMPPRERMQFLKAYSTLSRITENIVDESSNYYNVNGGCDNDGILMCSLNSELIQDGGILAGLSQNQIENMDIHEKFASLAYTQLSIRGGALGNPSFTTTDGINWQFTGDGNNIIVQITTEGRNPFPVTVTSNGHLLVSETVQQILDGSAGKNKKEFQEFLDSHADDLSTPITETIPERNDYYPMNPPNGPRHFDRGNYMRCQAMTPECGYDGPNVQQEGVPLQK